MIVEYANKVLTIDHTDDSYIKYLKVLKEENIPGLTISTHKSVRDVKKAIKEHSQLLAQYCGEMSSTTLLIHSDLKYKEDSDDDSVYDIISEMDALLAEFK